ncbi:Clavaminate synthase-like protein [Mollisia scopiformis]|uniref:Clavaminate synthase-like protein n=1 Tax=Mollisia scopiformis TaxID=149040 RepID=A0A194X839_MOLSC|nr:Clavaminate synthase-like protein [Mollisia scopiformis]KUJ16331.1 Clavaminate synthase-like protein [Mollisia scopiformis]
MAEGTERDPGRVYYVAGGFPQSRPILTGPDAKETFDKIPIIDFANLLFPSLEARQKLAKEVGHAAEHVGFFYAINTPVSNTKIDTIFDVIARFFQQPEEDKLQIECTKSNAAKGFMPAQQTGPHGVVRESFSMGNDYTEPEQKEISTAKEGAVSLNQWPDETLPEFRKAIYAYYHEMYPFAKKLVQIFALALGLPEYALDQYCCLPLTDITMQYYPVQSHKTEPMELLFPHADFGTLTLLLQNDVAGLEVLNANGIWIPAPPIPHSFVVNTGNYVEAWTNGRWPATVHRVHASLDKPRFSLPFFLSPSCDVVLSPLQELLKENETPRYEEQNIGQRHVKAMLGTRPSHPMTKRLREALKEEDWRYEILSEPSLLA